MTFFQLQYPTLEKYQEAINRRIVNVCALGDNPENLFDLITAICNPSAITVFWECEINPVQATAMVADMVVSIIKTSRGQQTKYSKMK